LKFYQLPNSNCFPTACYFSRQKPLVKPTAAGSFFIIFAFVIYFPLLLFSDLLNQNTKIPCCNLFIPLSIYPIFHSYLMLSCLLEVPYPKGIDNPFNTWGCEYLLFVHRFCLRGARRFAYWFDNLGLITEGNTCRRYTESSLPLRGNTDVVLADIT